jgi:hypothetical protein
MRPTIATALLLAATVPVAAQDVITWIDGTTTDRARVSDFTTHEIKWTAGGSGDKKPSDQVMDLSVAKVRETYKRGYAAKEQNGAETPDLFLGVAREELAKSPFLAQFGLWEAAKFLMESGKEAEAFPLFDELITKLPESGFVPRALAMKIDYYLATGKGKSADKVAKDYKELATTKGFPNGHVHEASYYAIMAQAATGGKLAELRGQLESLATLTESSYALVANRCRLQIAHSLRNEGKGEEALQLYNRLGQAKVIDKSTLAGAMLGTGHLHLAKGSDADKESFRSALISFLHVYIDTPEASPDIVAEALFHGADAAIKWGGSDHRLIAGRLRNMLRTDSRFSDTEWAKKL